jgi:hypothetical protein
VQLGVGAKAAAVLLREAKHQRPASDVVLAQARSPADVSKRRCRRTTRGGYRYRPKQQSDPAAWRCRNRESRRPPAGRRTSATPRTHASRHTTRTTGSSRPCDRRPARDRVGDPRCCSRWGCNSGPERKPAYEAIVGAGRQPSLLSVLAIVSSPSTALCVCHGRSSRDWSANPLARPAMRSVPASAPHGSRSGPGVRFPGATRPGHGPPLLTDEVVIVRHPQPQRHEPDRPSPKTHARRQSGANRNPA